jgi:hypothetical protein
MMCVRLFRKRALGKPQTPTLLGSGPKLWSRLLLRFGRISESTSAPDPSARAPGEIAF